MTASCVAGDTARLGTIIADRSANRVLLFSGGASYAASGAAAAVEPLLNDVTLQRIPSISPNPTLEEVERAIEVLRAFEPDLIVAAGGGSVIDLAKSVRALGVQTEAARAIITGSELIVETGPILVAIPTTAGTGSEATHFAVVYVDGVKHSLAHETVRPDIAVLDPALTYSVPPRLTGSTGLDALSQSMESLWSVRSTPASREVAERGMRLAFAALPDAVHRPDPQARLAMCQAAHLSGVAIDTSMTTASHALSYILTSEHGVPHGQAVALTLGAVLEFNASVTDDDCLDPRGSDHVRGVISGILRDLGAADPAAGRRIVEALTASLGLESTLSAVGAGSDKARVTIVESVNPQRLANNPRRLTENRLRDLIDSIP